MASYQQIDTRLAVLEDMLAFVMGQMRMRIAIGGDEILGPDGNPVPPRLFEGSLLDLYRLHKQLPVEKENG
jgi:hypothetical protein